MKAHSLIYQSLFLLYPLPRTQVLISLATTIVSIKKRKLAVLHELDSRHVNSSNKSI